MIEPLPEKSQALIKRYLNGTHIGFCGAGGTGKTTTAQEVARISGLPLGMSSTRHVFKMMGLETEEDQERLDGNGRIRLQFAIQDTFYANLKVSPAGISDRTPVDHYCYALYYCGNWLNEVEVQRMRDKLVDNLRRFKLIFYFPLVTYAGQSDGMRKDGHGYRMLYDMIMRQALADLSVEYYTMRTSGTPEERADKITQLALTRAIQESRGQN